MLLSELQVGDTIRWVANPEHIDVVVTIAGGKVYVNCKINAQNLPHRAFFGSLTSSLDSGAYVELKPIQEW
jgi:hypothetical protein